MTYASMLLTAYLPADDSAHAIMGEGKLKNGLIGSWTRETQHLYDGTGAPITNKGFEGSLGSGIYLTTGFNKAAFYGKYVYLVTVEVQCLTTAKEWSLSSHRGSWRNGRNSGVYANFCMGDTLCVRGSTVRKIVYIGPSSTAQPDSLAKSLVDATKQCLEAYKQPIISSRECDEKTWWRSATDVIPQPCRLAARMQPSRADRAVRW